jgi:hypothetical protein
MNLLIRVISYFLGTLRLKISGEYCERFLNIFAACLQFGGEYGIIE